MRLLHSREKAGRLRPWGLAVQRSIAACGTLLLLTGGTQAIAGEHIVSREDLQSVVADSQRSARENRAELLNLLGTPASRKALNSAGLEFRQVEQAVASLDEATAARLAARAREVNRDFAAGAFDNQMLTYIVIALAAAVIVLIAS